MSRRKRQPSCYRSDGVLKIRYDEDWHAEFAAASLTNDRSNGEIWHAFDCPDCDGWHIGRRAATKFDRCPRQRHYDDWAMELGERVEARMWQENSPRKSSRFDYIKRAVRSALSLAVMRDIPTAPPKGRRLP